MDLKTMEAELDLIVEDDSLKPKFRDWINATILAIAADVELPPLKLLRPETLEVDNTDWIWPMPTNFHKKLFRCTYTGSDGKEKSVTVHDRRDDLEYRDHTIQGPYVTSVAVAVEGDYRFLLIDPLPETTTTLNLYYYRKPATLTNPNAVCDCIPAEFVHQIIIPKVIARNYQALVDQVVSADLRSIQYWEGEYNKGMAAMLRFNAKSYRPPRRTGGRDPVGRGLRYGR